MVPSMACPVWSVFTGNGTLLSDPLHPQLEYRSGRGDADVSCDANLPTNEPETVTTEYHVQADVDSARGWNCSRKRCLARDQPGDTWA